ncbi:MAG: hydroxypyruvate isomerase [Sphingobacteriia bacterium]|nr:MAG: hydroxypyruvate isomerase [Sphingobacteriia bacterium]TAG29452.1 MAG: hydroxypyruvate isomerase [Sphingobacteriia bacterium]TAH06125.1 MAG: hydroxypyruvate isomerase [Sphingobacteriia bacterium]
MKLKDNRRNAIKNILAGSAVVAAAPFVPTIASCSIAPKIMKGNIHHTVCRWCFGDLTIEQLCVEAKKIGIVGIDLVGPSDWPILKKHGLISSMCNGAEIGLDKGWSHPEHHAVLIKNYTEYISLVAAAGFTNLICFSGNRNGMSDETGLNNAAMGLKKIMPLAEKMGITIVMELLNSKVDHKDYLCDKTAWGVELCKRIGSPNFKLLYDIYHMQIDEGDVISTLTSNAAYIAHYHTAGVPGRHEIDETQELYYPAIMKAILATGFKGFVAQEFIPTAKDKIASLKKAVEICDV